MPEPTVVELPSYEQPAGSESVTLRNGLMAAKITGSEIQDGTIFAKALVVGVQGWIHNLVWTATDYNTASWGSGTFTLASGESFSISSGNTGNISARTYVYFNKTTTLQTTTTYSVAVGDNNILIAIVDPDSVSTGFCIITALNSAGTTIDADKIVTGKIQSTDGKQYLDLNTGELVFSDASNPRFHAGYQSGGYP